VRFELLILDCDGVLVDSEPIANRVFADELRRIGLPMRHEEVCETFVGLTLARSVEIIEERLGRPVPAGFLDRLQARTFAAFRDGLAPVPGVREALLRIDLPCCVASSGEHEKMRLTLGLTGLLPRFEGRLYSALEVERGKPHPDLFLHAARQMGADPARAAVVEDSLPGVRAGVAAGMTVFGYAGHDDGTRLAAAGATVFHDMRLLPELLRDAGPY
jgi:phosphoglycolate phosphatase